MVPIIENGLIYNLLFQESYEEDMENFKNLLGMNEDYGYVGVVVFGENQVGSYMTNAVGASVRVQNQFNEVRDIVKGYFNCIMGNVMGNKIALMIPMEASKLAYNERSIMIDKAREMVCKSKGRLDVSFRMGVGHVYPLQGCMKYYHEAIQALTQTTGSVASVDDLPIR